MVEDPRVLDHAGLLFDGPPGITRAALRLVIRQIQIFPGADGCLSDVHSRRTLVMIRARREKSKPILVRSIAHRLTSTALDPLPSRTQKPVATWLTSQPLSPGGQTVVPHGTSGNPQENRTRTGLHESGNHVVDLEWRDPSSIFGNSVRGSGLRGGIRRDEEVSRVHSAVRNGSTSTVLWISRDGRSGCANRPMGGCGSVITASDLSQSGLECSIRRAA